MATTISEVVPRIFVPTSISGLQLWMDAADPFNNGTAPANNTNITTWADKSGQGNHMSVSAGAPKFVVDGGRTVADFASGDITITTSSLSFNTTATFIFVVFKFTSSNFGMIVAFTNYQNVGYGQVGDYSIRGSSGVVITTNDRNDVGNGIININTVSLASSQLNEFNLADTKFNETGTSRLQFSSSFAGRFFIGRVAELLYYNNASITVAQRQEIQAYLMWKWGIQSKIAVAHPFRETSPNQPLQFPLALLPTQRFQTQTSLLPGAGFVPTQISGCALWLDSADTSSISVTGSNVTQWRDKSGNNRHGNTGTSPFFNGDGVQFTGAQHLFIANASGLFANTAFHIFCVEKVASGGTGFFIGDDVVNGGSGTNQTLVIGYRNNTQLTFALWSNDQEITGLVGNPTRVWSFNLPQTNNRNTRLNGALVNTHGNSSKLLTMTTLTIGRIAGGNQYSGRIYEMIGYVGELSQSRILEVEGYLAWKWGIIETFAVTHPSNNTLFRRFFTSLLPLVVRGTPPVVVPSQLFAYIRNSANSQGWVASTSNGTTWSFNAVGATLTATDSTWGKNYISGKPDGSKLVITGFLSNGMMVSTNNGATWTAVTGLSDTTIIAPALWTGTRWLFGRGSIFAMDDNQQNITTVLATTGGNMFDLQRNPTTGTILAIGGQGGSNFIHRSTNGGTTWELVATGIMSDYMRGAAYSPTLNIWVAYGSGGMASSPSDGINGSWTGRNNIASQVENVRWIAEDGMFVASLRSEGYRTSTNGTTWSAAVVPANTTTFWNIIKFSGKYYARIILSGVTCLAEATTLSGPWTQVSTPNITPQSSQGFFVAPFIG